jgi:hypothetical protein
VVVPAVATVSLGASITLQAEARDVGGNLLNREAFWSQPSDRNHGCGGVVGRAQ